MPLILHHQNERSNDIGCITYECEYYETTYDQNCSGVTWDGGPAIEWCEEYKPEKPDNPPLHVDRQGRFPM